MSVTDSHIAMLEERLNKGGWRGTPRAPHEPIDVQVRAEERQVRFSKALPQWSCSHIDGVVHNEKGEVGFTNRSAERQALKELGYAHARDFPAE